MGQNIKYIKIANLVLWTENPRDPIDSNSSDQDIVNKAVLDKKSKWTLKKLAADMGDYYDLSELPTVVYKQGRPIVYDGNRRIILAKIKHGLVSIGENKINVPNVPLEIPCNVCSEEIALKNIYRKHSNNGSWDTLERDIFLYKYMHHDKSNLMLIEEMTNGFISTHPAMNKRFVKDEVFTNRNLNSIGFTIDSGRILSCHNESEVKTILLNLLEKIKDEQISTRLNRGDVNGVLDKKIRDLIEKNKKKTYKEVKVDFGKDDNRSVTKKTYTRKTRRVQSEGPALFGNDLILKAGDVNNLYRDICEIYNYYNDNRGKFSNSFTVIIRMSLRLLCETAAKGEKMTGIGVYIKKYFLPAKSTLSDDYKTFLSNQNVKESTLEQLLNTGAHNYSASKVLAQTIGVSIILGAMLSISYGKRKN